MRCLDTETGQFVEIDPTNVEYAILSHTWDRGGEQTLQDLRRIQGRYTVKVVCRGRSSPANDLDNHSSLLPRRLEKLFRNLVRIFRRSLIQHDDITPEPSLWDDPDLSPKVRDACAIARANGFRLIWIDSCCIDKTSSAELSEAINSMYAWYAAAQVCYAYLIDVPLQDDHSAIHSRFRRSVWFTRGWTLQELIAPFEVTLLSQDWKVMGSKRDFADLIEDITGISADALLHEVSLDEFSVAQRLSWTSRRETTRVEDRAYSLLGIFDINMPTLYGEGERAFRRLQEQIMQRVPDQSLFASDARICNTTEIHYTPNASEGQPSQPPRYSCQDELMALAGILPGTHVFSSSPSAFGVSGSGSIIAVSHDDVCRRLQLPHHPIPEYTPTPHGIRTQVPTIPIPAYLPPNAVIDCPNGRPSSQWYLVVLGCESTAYPGCLLGRVCYIPHSDSGVELLHYGALFTKPPAQGSRDWPNIFPLPSATIERCRPHMRLKTVFLTHPERANGPVQAASRRPHKTIHLMLSQKTSRALRARGYTADLRGPDEEHPTTHRLTLSGEGLVITTTYRHTSRHDAFTTFIIVGSVAVSQPGVVTALSPPENHYANPFVFSDDRPWKPHLHASVDIAVSEGRALRIKLSMNLAWQSTYFVDVEVVDITPDQPTTGSPDEAQRL